MTKQAKLPTPIPVEQADEVMKDVMNSLTRDGAV